MSEAVSIIRTPHSKERPYFSMARKSAQDESLSWEARGVLAYLLSKPDDWQVQIKDLQQKCGRDKAKSILKELLDAKYLTVKQEHEPKTGLFLRNVYKVYETPFTENPSTDNPLTEKALLTDKREVQNTDKQSPHTPRKRGDSRTKPNREAIMSKYVECPIAIRLNKSLGNDIPAQFMTKFAMASYLDAAEELIEIGYSLEQVDMAFGVMDEMAKDWKNGYGLAAFMRNAPGIMHGFRHAEKSKKLPAGMQEIR